MYVNWMMNLELSLPLSLSVSYSSFFHFRWKRLFVAYFYFYHGKQNRSGWRRTASSRRQHDREHERHISSRGTTGLAQGLERPSSKHDCHGRCSGHWTIDWNVSIAPWNGIFELSWRNGAIRGSALTKTGPAGLLIDYSIIGIIVFLIMAALGEMTSFAPMSRKSTQVPLLSIYIVLRSC